MGMVGVAARQGGGEGVEKSLAGFRRVFGAQALGRGL
jgi:hypothetical protein